MTAVAQQSDNPLAVAASLALIMGAVYVLGALSAHRRRRTAREGGGRGRGGEGRRSSGDRPGVDRLADLTVAPEV